MAAGYETKLAAHGFIFFINTGARRDKPETRGSGRRRLPAARLGRGETNDQGRTWIQVDSNEHPPRMQIYQPDTAGIVFMPGFHSDLGAGRPEKHRPW